MRKMVKSSISYAIVCYVHEENPIGYKKVKSLSTRAPRSRATCHLTDFDETLPV